MNTKLIRKILLITAVLLVIILSFFFIDRSRRKKVIYEDLKIEFDLHDIEYGSDVKARDLIRSHNGTLKTVNEPDTFVLGEQTLSYILSETEERYHQKVEKTFQIAVNVSDTQPPIIETEKDSITVYTGSVCDLKENILKVYDPVDGAIEDFEIRSDSDLSRPGTYEVNIKAKDRNGLSSEASYQLIVRNRPLSANEAFDRIFDILTQNYGYNEAAACGILANIRFESNFEPDVGDYYYGLCQWGGSRQEDLYSYCADNSLDASSIEGQLSFMEYELRNYYTGVRDYLLNVENSANGAWNAGDYFCRYYEGAASAEGRGDLAASYFN